MSLAGHFGIHASLKCSYVIMASFKRRGLLVEDDDCCCDCGYCCGTDPILLLLPLDAAAAVMVATEVMGIACSMAPLLPLLLL